MAKLKMHDSVKARGLRIMGTPFEERGYKMLHEVKRKAKTTGRNADPRRVLPLNSYAWQKLRASVLAGEPLCRHCAKQGLTVAATDVDHASGDPGDNRLANLQSLCHSCHSRKTASDHGKRIKPAIGLDGFPLTGDWAKP